jgi:hypothetical protein
MTRLRFLVLAVLACIVVTGCPASKGAKVGVYSAPSALSVPAWFIDPQNTTGCASDQNTGTQSTCTGGTNGPLKTWFGLANANWGCVNVAQCCPRLLQTVTVTFLSSHTDTSDPVYACAYLESLAAPSLIIQGALGAAQQVATGTTGTVTAKNRATPQPLATTFTLTAPDGGTAPTLLAGEFVVNTTHPSAAWINTVGSPNTMTQPLARFVLGTNGPAEVDTWANTDAVTIYQPVNVNVVQVSGGTVDLNTTSFNNGVVLLNVNVFDPNAAASFNFDPVYFTGHVGPTVAESQVSRTVALGNSPDISQVATFVNADIVGNIRGGPSYGQNGSLSIVGGQFRASGAIVGVATIDKDTIISANVTMQDGTLGFVFVPTSKTLLVNGRANTTSTAVIYGAGTLNVGLSGRLAYKAGASQAAAQLLVTTLKLNNQSLYITQLPNSATGIVTGNTALSAANLDTSFGATTGCALGAGAQICNIP